MRARLREVTNAAHERMHGHDGFGAAAAGAISPADYRDLLARLYGFHAAFDAGMAEAPPPSPPRSTLPNAAAPACSPPISPASALRPRASPRCRSARTRPSCGAKAIISARSMSSRARRSAAKSSPARWRLLVGENRRFFLGHGGENGRLWRSFLARLDRLDAQPDEAAAAERSALAVFAAFERWMARLARRLRGADARRALRRNTDHAEPTPKSPPGRRHPGRRRRRSRARYRPDRSRDPPAAPARPAAAPVRPRGDGLV